MNGKLSAIAIIFALMVTGNFVCAATKVDLDGISVSLSENQTSGWDDSLTIDAGETFYMRIELEEPDETFDDARLDVKIKVGDVLVYDEKPVADLTDGKSYYLNLSSAELTEDDLWKDNLMAYECKTHTIEVTVGGKDVKSSKTDKVKLKIEGDELKLKIKPANPSPSDDIIVSVVDEDDDEVKDVTVKFTNLGDDDIWDGDDEKWEDKTDKDGEVEITLEDEDDFEENLYGKYQVDAWSKTDNYCKQTIIIDARRSLNLTKIEPSNPKVGQTIKMRVLDESGKAVFGAKVSVSRTNEAVSYETDAQGYVLFPVNATGTYSIVAAKTNYADSAAVKISVGDKESLNVDLTPSKDIRIGEEVEIIVSGADGNGIKDARILITKPDGTIEELKSGEGGKTIYTPKNSGEYLMKVDVQLYASVEKKFSAYKIMSVILSERLAPNAEITVTVRDVEDKPLKDAEVAVKEAGKSGQTDYNGKYVFKVSETGTYTLSVKREGFLAYEKKIDIKGSLAIKIRTKSVNLGDEVEFVVEDGEGNLVASPEIKIIDPRGDEEKLSGAVYTADKPGKYTAKAEKFGYGEAVVTFEVKEMLLTLKSGIEGKKITATALSEGKPVTDVPINFSAEGFFEEVITDKEGRASVDIGKTNLTGTVTITASAENYEKVSVTQEIKAAETGDTSTLLIILVALVILVIAIIAVTTQKEGRRREKGMLYRSTGSKLEKGW